MNRVNVGWGYFCQNEDDDGKQGSREKEWKVEGYHGNDEGEKMDENENGQERNEGPTDVGFELEKFLLNIHHWMRKMIVNDDYVQFV